MALRIALLGTGVIAAPHVTALRALAGAVDLVAICDQNRAKGEAFRQAWSIPEFYDDLDTMIGCAKPSVVHVLLPPAAHARAAIDCLECGCHVFVEKPFCLTSEECRSVLKTAEANNRQIGVDHNLTYMPPVLKTIDEIRNCRLGEVHHVTVMYNMCIPALAAGKHDHWMFGKPERILLEAGPHPISVIYRLLGRIVSAATAVSGRRILNNGQAFYERWQSSLVCERGTGQFLLALNGEYLNNWVHVLGQDGEIFADIRRNTIQISEKTRYARAANLADCWKSGVSLIRQSIGNFRRQLAGTLGAAPVYDMQTFSIDASVRAFYTALANGTRPPVSGEDGAAVVEACECVIGSAMDFLSYTGAEHAVTNG